MNIVISSNLNFRCVVTKVSRVSLNSNTHTSPAQGWLVNIAFKVCRLHAPFEPTSLTACVCLAELSGP